MAVTLKLSSITANNTLWKQGAFAFFNAGDIPRGQMIGRLISILTAMGLIAFGYCAGDRSVQPSVLLHLDLAKKCALSGQAEIALAHVSVVTPDHVLRVRVDCSSLPPADQGIYRDALSGAFRMWESALGQQVFEVTEAGQADIVIHFQHEVNDKGVGVCGHSEWRKGVLNRSTVVFNADIKIRMIKPNGQFLSFDQLRACAAHEFGHVLGLEDSPNLGDVMGMMDFDHPVTAIRPDEVDTLLRARSEADQIRRSLTSSAAKAKE